MSRRQFRTSAPCRTVPDKLKHVNEKSSTGPQRNAPRTPTASRVLGDGSLIELLFSPERNATALAVWRDGRCTIEAEVADRGETLVPFSPHNNLIKNGVIVLPSQPAEYGTKDELVADIRNFVHRYLDGDPAFELVVAHYVLFTWLYDRFREVPYIRFQGDYGTGKTRALLIVGSLCYKAFFASGASTVSPLFHILDAFRGTLVLDEADFRFTDEKADIVKLLNNGNVDGLPVLRTMISRQREFNPQAFHVFGPKVVAMRRAYDDQALESRFITQVMGNAMLRADIPINLPPAWKDEALELRNKLLLFRFHHRHSVAADESASVPSLSARGNQILLPLLSIVDSRPLREALIALVSATQQSAAAERGLSTEAQVLEIIYELRGASDAQVISMRDIAQAFRTRFGQEYERPITPRWIGAVLRQRLHLTPYKSNGHFVLAAEASTRLEALYEQYGLTQVERGGSPIQ